MYIITGKITENKRDRAYTVFGIKEQKSGLLTRQEVKKMMISGEEVLGLNVNLNFNDGYNVHKNRSFLWKRIPEINGKCEPEDPKDKETQILVGTNGFKEARHFITVNSLGEIKVYSLDEVRQEIDKGHIVGAVNTANKKVIIQIKNELSDEWLQNLGYVKDKNSNWQKNV